MPGGNLPDQTQAQSPAALCFAMTSRTVEGFKYAALCVGGNARATIQHLQGQGVRISDIQVSRDFTSAVAAGSAKRPREAARTL